jgi:hypothetical protein
VRRLALAVTLSAATAAACAQPPARTILADSSTLPEFARPRGRVIENAAPKTTDLVLYRPLTRDDFQSAEPPDFVGSHRDRVGAYTCGQIRLAGEGSVRGAASRGPDGAPSFRVPASPITFEAFMDPRCSWWNNDQKVLPSDYVLEHEQIHFALFELTARSMNARAAQILEEVTVTAPSAQYALEESKRKIEGVLERAIRQLLEQSARFDEDTSGGFKPDAQKQWKARVEAELAAK